MARLQHSFNPDEVPERDNFDPIPNGDYIVEILDSEEKATKSGTGYMLVFTYKVVEGEYEGRLLWDRINYINNNETAQRIGQQTIGAIQSACGLREVMEDTEVLHGRYMKVRVVVDGEYNAVKKYMSIDDAASTAPAPRNVVQAPARREAPDRSNNRTVPWRK